jgi:hypothetical protein
MSGALVPVSQIENLPAEYREHAVTSFLAQARDRLSEALEATGPQAVAAVKAEVATVAEMAKQLDLSKECRDDSTEMVRRAEYTLDKAIRKGQEEGVVSSDTNSAAVRYGHLDQTSMPRPSEFFGGNGQARSDAYQMGQASEEEFEQALTDARDEGNLSRANVVRKVKNRQSPRTRNQLADQIAALAIKGNASSQIAKQIGVGEDWVRRTAKDYDIPIPADKALNKSRRIDPIRVARETVVALDGLASTVELVTNLDGLDPREAMQWTASLDQSIRALNRLNKKIKEAVL